MQDMGDQMKDPCRKNQELLEETSDLKQRIHELGESELECKCAEEALRKIEDRYRTLVENASDVVFRTDDTGRFTFVNPATLRITGYEENEIIGMRYTTLIRPDMRNEAMKFFGSQFAKGIPNTYSEYPIIAKDGHEVWLGQNTQLIAEDGHLIGFQAVSRDITDRKRIEEELRDSEERYRKIIEASSDAILLRSPKSIIYANPAALKLFRANHPGNLIGKQYLDLVHPDDRAISAERVKRTMDENWIASSREHRIVALDGKVVHVESTGVPVKYRGETHVFGIFRDITKRKQAEQKLLESEEKYRNILENIEDGYFEVDLAGNFTFFNSSHCRILGYPKEEMMGMNNRAYMDSENAKKVFRAFNEVYESGIPTKGFEWETIRKDGTRTSIEVSVSLIARPGEKPTGFRGIARDITKRKKAEVELQRTLNSLRKAISATVQVMVSAIETRDPYTAGHQLRSADLARTIATEMGLSHEEIEGIRIAGSIHDIGKLSVPAEILSKPTKLSGIEFSLIKEHAQRGYEILKDVESSWPLAEIVYQHHERMDGSGYPRNLKGEEILIEARIIAVADVVEAMASHRPYRPALGLDAALEEIEKNRGILYDSQVADTCLRVFREKNYHIITPATKYIKP
jgi:PAS domain S-box-containing protein